MLGENVTRLAVLMAIFLLALSALCAQNPNAVSQGENRYANELPTFKFFKTAPWRSLVPLVSTMKDVRMLLGSPQEASDASAFTVPYPGDQNAKEPVFTYRLNPGWEVLVYFTRYCFHSHPKGIPDDRLCSIDLIPTKRIPFDTAMLSTSFKKMHVQAVDAAWDEYSDGTGLRYEVYTTHPQYGQKHPGDLYRISYGPRPENVLNP